MEMGINFQSNNNKSVLIMKVREARSELHRNDDSDSEFTAADEAIKVSMCGLLCNKVHNEKPFDPSTYMYSDDMSTFFVFIDFDLRQKLILLVHLLFFISFMCFIGFQHQVIKNALDYVYFLTSMSLLSTLGTSRRLTYLHIDVDIVAVHHYAISIYCCSNEVCRVGKPIVQSTNTYRNSAVLYRRCLSVSKSQTSIQALGITPI